MTLALTSAHLTAYAPISLNPDGRPPVSKSRYERPPFLPFSRRPSVGFFLKNAANWVDPKHWTARPCGSVFFCRPLLSTTTAPRGPGPCSKAREWVKVASVRVAGREDALWRRTDEKCTKNGISIQKHFFKSNLFTSETTCLLPGCTLRGAPPSGALDAPLIFCSVKHVK